MIFHRFFDQQERRERFGGDCLEFQHCKLPQGTDIKTLVAVDSIKHWQDESIYLSGDDWNLFIEHYGDIITGGTYANGECGPLDLCGINYFTAEQRSEIIHLLEEKQPLDCKALLLWLQEAADSNGFYVLGL